MQILLWDYFSKIYTYCYYNQKEIIRESVENVSRHFLLTYH